MKKADFINKAKPHIIILVLFMVISVIFMYPALEGKQLYQNDILQSVGATKEIIDFRQQYQEETLWTNSMFSGMPTYLLSFSYKSNLIKKLNFISNPSLRPFSFIFIYLIGFYIALLLFGVNPWLSFAGAVAYAFSSYFIAIIGAGHVFKVWALGYMPPIIAGVYIAFRGKILLGSAITGLFLALQLLANHLQITYYTLLFIMIYGIFELVHSAQNNTLKQFFKTVTLLFIVSLLAVFSHFSALWTTYEYGKYSIRGKSELTTDAENKTGGLDRDYVTQWSIGVDESLSLLIPNIKGASSAFGTNSKSYDLLKRSEGGTAYARQMLPRLPSYWGDQPHTVPVYAGAVICFLFVFGLFVVKGRIKWWLLTATVLSIMLSWGKNFPAFTNLMLDYFPGYNKFRSVSMAIIIAEFTMPLLGILAIKEIITNMPEKKELLKYLKYPLYILGGIILLLLMFPGIFGLSSPADDQMINQGQGVLVDAFVQDRKTLLRQDAFRSLIFILLPAGLILLYINKTIKVNYLIGGLILLIFIDLWPVNKRYLNSDNFITKRESKNSFTASTADLLIIKDKEPGYRVLNLTVGPFMDASTSYFHRSIGGYHGAKMKRYQELIEYHIGPEINKLAQAFNSQPTTASLDSVMSRLNVLNMLNTRYIIYNREAPPLVNKSEPGSVWFVNSYRIVENSDEEIIALGTFNPKVEVLIDKRYDNLVKDFTPPDDSAADIFLAKYLPNHLTYKSISEKEQIAVFSEIFYDKGWQAYIDGNPAPHIRANYTLRAMRIPAGEHTIEFKFHPESYYTGEKVSLAGSLILILMLMGAVVFEVRKGMRED